MDPYSRFLSTLSSQARSGDAGAASRLHRELEPCVVVMVRQTLQPNGAKSLLDRRIRMESRRAGLSSSVSLEEREALIQKVAQCVCRSCIADLRSPPRQASPLADTVGFADAPSLAH